HVELVDVGGLLEQGDRGRRVRAAASEGGGPRGLGRGEEQTRQGRLGVTPPSVEGLDQVVVHRRDEPVGGGSLTAAETGGGGGSRLAIGLLGVVHPGREAPVEQGDLERSEEHTSELQSRENLVCRLLLEKKKPQQSIKD